MSEQRERQSVTMKTRSRASDSWGVVGWIVVGLFVGVVVTIILVMLGTCAVFAVAVDAVQQGLDQR